jgi:hypothetical protein
MSRRFVTGLERYAHVHQIEVVGSFVPVSVRTT